jgi:hypothetical protein
MHPTTALPAIEAALADVKENIRRFAEMSAKLTPGQQLVSFNPHVAGPGGEELPVSVGEFRFWEIADEESFSTFMEGLAIQLDMLDLSPEEYQKLPPGYGIVRYVLRFETHCKFSSWIALENVGPDDMLLVRQHYEKAGLTSEAEALAKAEAAWYAANGHEGSGYDAARDAYESVNNPFQDEDERWFQLLDILRDEKWWLSG